VAIFPLCVIPKSLEEENEGGEGGGEEGGEKEGGAGRIFSSFTGRELHREDSFAPLVASSAASSRLNWSSSDMTGTKPALSGEECGKDIYCNI
jgi:hypothetical protein